MCVSVVIMSDDLSAGLGGLGGGSGGMPDMSALSSMMGVRCHEDKR